MVFILRCHKGIQNVNLLFIIRDRLFELSNASKPDLISITYPTSGLFYLNKFFTPYISTFSAYADKIGSLI